MMNWTYYGNALLPTTPPHIDACVEELENGEVWKSKIYFARWTTDFDCKRQTEWWYVIKDNPFDIAALKSKRRYEIKKGEKNFEVKKINAADYSEEIYEIQVAAFSAYPAKYRPSVNRDDFIKQVKSWNENGYAVYGAFYRESNKLCGYAYLICHDDYCEFNVLKTIPEFEKFALNAAIVYKILTDFNDKLSQGSGYYICDGARAVVHETAFQDYLQKYFDFRVAYCKLNIKYNPKYKPLISICYAFRHIFKLFDGIRIVHKINSIIKMEEIIRRQKKHE